MHIILRKRFTAAKIIKAVDIMLFFCKNRTKKNNFFRIGSDNIRLSLYLCTYNHNNDDAKDYFRFFIAADDGAGTDT